MRWPRYKKNLGAVNRALAQMADRVTEVVFRPTGLCKGGRGREDSPDGR